MEQSLYIFLFVLSLGVLFLAQYRVKNYTDKFLLFIVSGVLFLALMIQSFNIQVLFFDPNTQEYIAYNMASEGYEYLLPVGVCFICSAFSLLSAFINLAPIWNKNFKNSDLKQFSK